VFLSGPSRLLSRAIGMSFASQE